MKTLAILLLVVVFLKSFLLYKTFKALPLHELRRRARAVHDRHSRALYKLLAFGASLKIFIWLLGATSGAILFLLATRVSGWLAAALIFVVSWLMLDDRFAIIPGGWLWKISSYAASLLLPLVNFLHPILGRVASVLGQPKTHNHVYERQDLLELLDRQKGQIDNRISDAELKAARGALTFGQVLVGAVMTPRKAVVFVSRDESIGPKLMDDLHKTGFSRFPVIRGNAKQADPEVVGTLYLGDLLKNLQKTGKVSDIMKRDAGFINESHSLEQALDGFLKSGHHLLIVVNNFEETVGVLTLEEVLSQIVGRKINNEFDSYHDKRAVAGHDAKKTDGEHAAAGVE